MQSEEDIKKQKLLDYQREYQREYRKRHEKVFCACGGKYNIDHKNKHLSSNKHQKYVMLLDPEAKYHYDRFFKM